MRSKSEGQNIRVRSRKKEKRCRETKIRREKEERKNEEHKEHLKNSFIPNFSSCSLISHPHFSFVFRKKNHFPCLLFFKNRLTAADVMSQPLVVLKEIETAGDVLEMLRSNTHNAFPVGKERKKKRALEMKGGGKDEKEKAKDE